MSAGNGSRASAAAIDRTDTPEGQPLLRLAREAAQGSPGQAILIVANVVERCIQHSHIAATAAQVSTHETRQTRERVDAMSGELAQHRADTKAELTVLATAAKTAATRQAERDAASEAAVKALSDKVTDELRTSTRWSRAFAGGLVIAALIVMELLK